MFQPFFPIRNRWLIQLCLLVLLVLGKCFLSNYLEPQNTKWQSLVLTQYCYFNLLELAEREEHVNKIVCVHTVYYIQPQNIFFDLDHIKWKGSKHSLLLGKQTREYKLPGPAELCVLLDQKPILAEFTAEEPAVPPPQTQHIYSTQKE